MVIGFGGLQVGTSGSFWMNIKVMIYKKEYIVCYDNLNKYLKGSLWPFVGNMHLGSRAGARSCYEALTLIQVQDDSSSD